MKATTQRRMIRTGLALAGVLAAGVLTTSLAPMHFARADTAREAPVPAAPAVQPEAQESAPAQPVPAAEAHPASFDAGDPMQLKRVLEVKGPFRHGDYVWDEEGVPPGEVIITVDLQAQTIAVFRGGYQIGAAVILYGADDKPTPLGTFPIMQKKVDHVSNLYGAPMPYMMRLTNDGVAIHASEVAWGNATHGCIGVPLAFAKLVFAEAKLGTRVIVTSGKMMAVPQGAQMAQAALHSN
ncbi:L,D-transpeptidase family protein [Sphingobium sp. SYK-6]|uniref:L,D-transpeptidase family protein n=1 Tax=Sphingobium sp. (strain NBRC 103272 / SYK-6) TaxID=627192 RepID=UPI000307FBFF|nr:L,D-transpeptidase family protein [Sphingobium sp. SYK-6]